MTIKDKLILLVKEGKINFYTLECILREIDSKKKINDLTKDEINILIAYLNNNSIFL